MTCLLLQSVGREIRPAVAQPAPTPSSCPNKEAVRPKARSKLTATAKHLKAGFLEFTVYSSTLEFLNLGTKIRAFSPRSERQAGGKAHCYCRTRAISRGLTGIRGFPPVSLTEKAAP